MLVQHGSSVSQWTVYTNLCIVSQCPGNCPTETVHLSSLVLLLTKWREVCCVEILGPSLILLAVFLGIQKLLPSHYRSTGLFNLYQIIGHHLDYTLHIGSLLYLVHTSTRIPCTLHWFEIHRVLIMCISYSVQVCVGELLYKCSQITPPLSSFRVDTVVASIVRVSNIQVQLTLVHQPWIFKPVVASCLDTVCEISCWSLAIFCTFS